MSGNSEFTLRKVPSIGNTDDELCTWVVETADKSFQAATVTLTKHGDIVGICFDDFNYQEQKLDQTQKHAVNELMLKAKEEASEFIKRVCFSKIGESALFEPEGIEKEVLKILDAGSIYLERISDGQYQAEIYADYRDELSDDTILEILNNTDPLAAFNEKIVELYEDSAESRYDEIEEDVRKRLCEALDVETFSDEIVEEIRYIVMDHVSIKYPENHFLDQQEICVDIVIDTGDANYDFSANMDAVDPDQEINENASILWLAKQQGYTEKQLRKYLTEDDHDCVNPVGFLQSVYVERLNTPSAMGALTVLAKMMLRDLLELNIHMKRNGSEYEYDPDKRPDCGSITISKKAMVGLYNSWSGAGGPFEIQLEKDMVLPVKYIFSAKPDSCTKPYSVEQTYGMCRSAWKDVVSGIDPSGGVLDAKAS